MVALGLGAAAALSAALGASAMGGDASGVRWVTRSIGWHATNSKTARNADRMS